MPGALDSIDTSVIEELAELKVQRDTVLERLERLEAKRGEVSEEVYVRVRRDYEHRREELERAAAPLLERARAEYAKLGTLLGRLEAEVRQSRLDLEELDLRHELGEFGDDEYGKRREAGERRLSEQEARLEEAVALRERFVDAAGSAEALEGGAPPEEPAPEPPPAGPERVPAPPPEATPAGGTVVIELPDGADRPVPETTAAIPLEAAASPPSPQPPAPPEPPAGATMLIQWPRLELRRPSGEREELALSGARSRLGSAPDNDVVLEGAKVDPHHAEIALGEEGYTIRDLGSKTGVLVNGVVVTERVLAEGDEIRIGELTLVFHEP